jgi:YVTN family beta-propeller protein
VGFRLFVVGVTVLTILTGRAVAAESAAPYKIAMTIPLGSGEQWDYVTFDSSANRVYVAHGDHVTVVDPAKGAVIGNIGTFPGGTHGIDVSTENSLGYTDDGKAGTAAAFDLRSLKVVKQIPTALDADGVIFDPASHNIFVINGDSGSITVIDPKSDTAIGSITIGAALEAGIADGNGKLFVDGAENHDIVVIDTLKRTVLAHWPMADCVRPHGIAVDGKTHRVFATCINKEMIVVDADNGRNIATLPIGNGSDGAAFDAKRKLILSSNREGTLSVVHEKDADHFEVLGTVTTLPSARTIAIDPKTGRLFLPAADIAKIDPPATLGGRPHVTYVPGSLKLVVIEPTAGN